MDNPWFLPWLFFVAFVSIIPSCSSQSNLPQNFEAFYPFTIETPSSDSAPSSRNQPPNSTLSSPALAAAKGGLLPQTKKNVLKAVAVTAATTFITATVFFFLIQRYIIIPRRRKLANQSGGGAGQPAVSNNQFARRDRKNEGLSADENSLDVLYWKRFHEKHRKVFRSKKEGEATETRNNLSPGSGIAINSMEKPGFLREPSNPPHIPPPASSSMAISDKEGPGLPPSPPIPVENAIPNATTDKQVPAPPPVPAKKIPPPAPQPPKATAKLPGLQKGKRNNGLENSSTGEDMRGAGNGQVKLKPLHWDKLSMDCDHSMVWDRIDGGSFKFDDDLMEALFGYGATNRRSSDGDVRSSDSRNHGPSLPPQITILDARKSQNTAIVLKSLVISHDQIVDAISEGRDLDVDILEKLTKTAPTKEEQSQILGYQGDPARLADAESFHYHLLRVIPSAFHRISAMLFRFNYDSEITNFKRSLQTLELGCKELRNRGLFVKLLEAVLKAGNRMNVGTSRGNAQAFKLSSLSKLSDVRSTDGKTTLLHFVVEEVVRTEGKRCVLSRNRSFNRSNSRSSNVISENSESKQERQMECMKLGLPVVGGLGAELSNVKKAAQIDYSSFATTCSALTARVSEIGSLVSECDRNGEEGFIRKMTSFLKAAEEEVGKLREEQVRIMELVKKTTEYYQAGGGVGEEAHPLKIFVITKEFLGMVDQACVEIARKLQRRRTGSSGSGLSQKSSEANVPVRFPNLPEHFMKEDTCKL